MKLKKLFAGLISLAAALIAVCVITVCAGAETSGDYEYEILDDGTVEITDYNGDATEVVIPSTLDGKTVTSIGGDAFFGCSSLASIIIPNGVTSIGCGAFGSCSKLTSIDIPDSVTNIEEFAFNDCSSLTSIDIHDGVTNIGVGAFGFCSSLTSINVDDNNEYFSSQDGILFDKDMTELLACPGGKAGEYIIPDGVTCIGDSTFSGCQNLTSIIIPNGVTSIGYGAFEWCENLTSIDIPDSVTSIGGLAFWNCESLTSINIPDSVTTIESQAFSGCSSLTEITIPGSVTRIGYGAFEACSSLTSITVDDNNEYYSSQDGVLFNKDMTELLACPGGKTGEYAIPDGVTSIGGYAFYRCSSLTSIDIPDTVTNIGYYALFECSKLTSISIPDGVTSIGDYAFGGCSSLTSVTISNSVTKIKRGAFSDCFELKDVYFIGSQTQWLNIDIGTDNECLFNADIHFSVDDEHTHTPAEPVIENNVDPTCAEEGYYEEVIYCEECGEEISRTPVTVPATGEHAYVDKVVAPTYTDEGYTLHTCSVCGDSYKDTYTAKKTVSAVTGLSLKGRSGDALRISWTKNTSADGYIIEMKDGTKWTRVVKITKNSTTEYRIAKLATGTAYNFRIRAYKMDGKTALYSGYTTISARTNPSAVSGLKLKGRAGDALRISWTKNASADGYIIEMKSGNSWVRVGKVTKNSTVEFRKAGLKAGTAYSFRVKAYKMSGKTALYSGYTTISARTNPSTVSGLKLKNTNSSAVRLAWSKNTSVDGYIIEMKSGNSWVRVGKVTKNSTVEFRKGSLKGKTSYSFRIKAYKMSGKTVLYSGYTTVTVKTK